ncbi:AAA family ATPase [Methylomonas sp. SURF-1]|uniref:AAA family ATPase n=1 Tax=Methylomonas aurea TaxID=2952224 RepID=A0ABT1UMK2_9GAMM|nr:AAA family ATPase [Methylomonas sp. SURF-1]MCQ8183474.1 AAA family ATPase [Methylomonas sp. SURF-1]
MKIISFEYHDERQPGWNYTPITLNAINLFVGETGSGKTKLLNTLFDIGVFVAQGHLYKGGKWEIIFEGEEAKYKWNYDGEINNEGVGRIVKEEVVKIAFDGTETTIISRGDDFIYKGHQLPKLVSGLCSIYLLKEEPIIEDLYQAFLKILRRSFSDDALKQSLAYSSIPDMINKELMTKKSLETLSTKNELNLSLKLYFLKKYFKSLYDDLIGFYKSIFPAIDHCDVKEFASVPDLSISPHKVPIFCIREKNVHGEILLHNLSAGMQKVLLIMTDIISLPRNSLYLIDEYENSLGINAIDFLPSFLADHGINKQFIITTHHPYLINNMPIVNWQIFHRNGSNVTIKCGGEYVEKFGHSKQKAFIQLINDPFYTKGLR